MEILLEKPCGGVNQLVPAKCLFDLIYLNLMSFKIHLDIYVYISVNKKILV